MFLNMTKQRCVCGYAYDFYLEDEDATIMQSTGLFGAFGAEIFEGDIVTKDQGETFGVVRYGICRSSLCFYIEQNYKGSKLTYPINLTSHVITKSLAISTKTRVAERK